MVRGRERSVDETLVPNNEGDLSIADGGLIPSEGDPEGTTFFATKILTPLYVYPDTRKHTKSVYRRVAASNSPQVVILNPANGLGARRRPNRDWKKAVNALRAQDSAVEKVVGYTHLQWLNKERTVNDVKENIDQYVRNKWDVDGIFFDESPASSSAFEDLRVLSEHVKTVLGPDALVVLNPGTHVPMSYLDIADVVVVFENFYSEWDTFSLERYDENVRRDPENPFAVIIRNVPDSAISDTYNEAITRGVHYVFIGRQGAEFHSPGCFFFEQMDASCPV